VVLSTIEIEYITLAEGAKEGICLKSLMDDLRFAQGKIVIFCDSLNVICLTKNHV